jgi:hypothetical protein
MLQPISGSGGHGLTVLEVVRIILGLLLIFVLPGTMLIKAMFPRKGELDEEYNGLYVITLGMATSICVTILVGFVLGSLPLRSNDKGYFDTPYIVASLVLVTVVFFVIGWWRGAYPWLGLLDKRFARFPMPAEAPTGTKRHDELLAEIETLTKRRDALKREVKDMLRRERSHPKSLGEHYKERRERAEAELKKVTESLERAKEEQSKLIYEAKKREDEKRRRREERREKRERAREQRKAEVTKGPELPRPTEGERPGEGAGDGAGGGAGEGTGEGGEP